MAEAGAPIGNQNAKKAKRWQDSLLRALSRAANSTVDAGLDKIADLVVAQAMAGDKDSWMEIANRLDGKAAQSLTVSGDEQNPLRTINEVLLRAVDAK